MIFCHSFFALIFYSFSHHFFHIYFLSRQAACVQAFFNTIRVGNHGHPTKNVCVRIWVLNSNSGYWIRYCSSMIFHICTLNFMATVVSNRNDRDLYQFQSQTIPNHSLDVIKSQSILNTSCVIHCIHFSHDHADCHRLPFC